MNNQSSKTHLITMLTPIMPISFMALIFVLAAYTYSNLIFATLAFVTLLLFICFAIYLLSEKNMYTTKVNGLFLIRKYPWSKYHFIGQRKATIDALVTCKERIRAFAAQEKELYNAILPERIYIAYTHTNIIVRLKKYPDITVRKLADAAAGTLAANLTAIVGRNCGKCLEKQQCPWRHMAENKTVFQSIIIIKSPALLSFV